MRRSKCFAPDNPSLATAVAGLARLVKGYSDTHTQSQAVFVRLSGIVDGLTERDDGAQVLSSLVDAALADASGKTLDLAISDIDAVVATPSAA